MGNYESGTKTLSTQNNPIKVGMHRARELSELLSAYTTNYTIEEISQQALWDVIFHSGSTSFALIRQT
jgi:hypothetical protein